MGRYSLNFFSEHTIAVGWGELQRLQGSSGAHPLTHLQCLGDGSNVQRQPAHPCQDYSLNYMLRELSTSKHTTQETGSDGRMHLPHVVVVHRHLEKLSKIFKYVKCTKGWKDVFIILKLFIKRPCGCDYSDSEISHYLYLKVSYISPLPHLQVLTSVMNSVITIFTVIFTGFNTHVCISK